MTRLIGVCGQGPKSGKSEAANIILKLLNKSNPESSIEYIRPWIITRFANEPKRIISNLTGLLFTQLNDQQIKDSIVEGWENSQGIPRTARQLLIDLSEGMKNCISDDIWVKTLFKSWNENSFNWIIDDLRFIPEARKIKQEGGIIIKVMNKNAEKGEIELPDEFVDYWVDNNAYSTGFPEYLEMQIKKVLEREKLI